MDQTVTSHNGQWTSEPLLDSRGACSAVRYTSRKVTRRASFDAISTSTLAMSVSDSCCLRVDYFMESRSSDVTHTTDEIKFLNDNDKTILYFVTMAESGLFWSHFGNCSTSRRQEYIVLDPA